MARTAGRRGISSGFYAVIPERLITSPNFCSLKNMRDIGLYFALLGRSDVFGCLLAYPTSEVTRASTLGSMVATMTPTEYRHSLLAVIEAGLVISLSWGGCYVFLLPHKLPSASLSYYPTPRIIPINVIVPQIMERSQHDHYLAELVKGFNFARVMEQVGVAENAAMADVVYPEWLRKGNAPEEIKSKPRPKPRTEEIPLDIPKQGIATPRTTGDLRVVEMQNYIVDNGFDINIPDTDMLTLLVKYGKKYTTRMIDLYGDWRTNNPSKAKKHKSHYRAIQADWVHEKCFLTVSQNPNDELIELRYNVFVSAVEKNALLQAIQSEMGVTDPHDQKEWLMSLADRVSGSKKKHQQTNTDQDANKILEAIERQIKWSK
jgi:hypothetical protein